MPFSNHDLRAAGAALLLASLSTGCSSIGGGDAQSVYDIARQVVSPHRVTLEEAAATPYASLGVRVGSSPEIMIILATNTGNEQLWTSALHIGITTAAGRVVRTSGLEHDLAGLVLQSRNKANPDAAQHWLADFPDLNAYSVPMTCKTHPMGNETIEILGKPIQTRRIAEDCEAEARTFIWTFRNTYWIDPASGLVWRSIQHTHPKLDVLELEVLRPPG